ncbi:MAG: hypothetical protein IPK04_15515 [Bdellovibrionales bacterium]|nr:hypothetical protein [Bdellovibrionales bacterium]
MTDPGLGECKICGSEILSEELAGANRSLPDLVTVSEAHGLQLDVISDHDGRRNHHRAIQELKRMGRPTPDEMLEHPAHPGDWHRSALYP